MVICIGHECNLDDCPFHGGLDRKREQRAHGRHVLDYDPAIHVCYGPYCGNDCPFRFSFRTSSPTESWMTKLPPVIQMAAALPLASRRTNRSAQDLVSTMGAGGPVSREVKASQPAIADCKLQQAAPLQVRAKTQRDSQAAQPIPSRTSSASSESLKNTTAAQKLTRSGRRSSKRSDQR